MGRVHAFGISDALPTCCGRLSAFTQLLRLLTTEMGSLAEWQLTLLSAWMDRPQLAQSTVPDRISCESIDAFVGTPCTIDGFVLESLTVRGLSV